MLPSCLSFPTPSSAHDQISFSDFEPQSQTRQGEDGPGPPISQNSTLPQLQSCPQRQSCLDIPSNGPCPTLRTPCRQALGLILSLRQSSSHTDTAWSGCSCCNPVPWLAPSPFYVTPLSLSGAKKACGMSFPTPSSSPSLGSHPPRTAQLQQDSWLSLQFPPSLIGCPMMPAGCLPWWAQHQPPKSVCSTGS